MQAAQLATLALVVDDQGGLVPGMPALEFYILDMLSASVVFGIPFLQRCNPLIDWVACTISFGHFHILALSQHEAAPIEVGSLCSLLKTIHKTCAIVWFCLLQPRASSLAMGVSKQP